MLMTFIGRFKAPNDSLLYYRAAALLLHTTFIYSSVVAYRTDYAVKKSMLKYSTVYILSESDH